jgi:anti-sigma factor RsiW
MINEHDFTQLNEYLDGDLNEAERRSFEARLAHEPDLQAELEALRGLLHEAQSLPKSLQPERDLWQDISKCLHEPAAQDTGRVVRFRRRSDRSRQRRAAAPASTWPLVAAAGVVFALFLGVQYFSKMHVETPPAEHVTKITPVTGEPEVSEAEAVDLEYAQARAELLKLLEARKADLPEDTLASIEQSLGAIEDAVVDIRRALDEYPEDPRLKGMLHQAYRSEMDVLQEAATMPEDDG